MLATSQLEHMYLFHECVLPGLEFEGADAHATHVPINESDQKQ